MREDLTRNTSQIPLQSNPAPSFNQFKSKGMFVFQDCTEAPTPALDRAASPNFLRDRNGMRVLCTLLLLCRVSSDLGRSFRNQHARKSSTPIPIGMQATFMLYKIGHLPIYLPWHDYLSGIILQQ